MLSVTRLPLIAMKLQHMTSCGFRVCVVMCRGQVAFAAVGVTQETVFPLNGSGLRRNAWATSYDSLPSSAALDDGLDPEHAMLDG